ncbi:hypothetical protein PRIPAC_77545 [Pristionchus pacificus]|uniref:guanylate cyclase n=1 Tax=Pristionchus pacificus TaxID=54126 RepID=A0A2A6CN16_PRIPA|nr:hypothetical protein PRIPAC_77545 [Pristionchus pacificus]|eukprot:PDM79421.1 Adenylate and Guanylate cyclase [Pristionchus pacificus]
MRITLLVFLFLSAAAAMNIYSGTCRYDWAFVYETGYAPRPLTANEKSLLINYGIQYAEYVSQAHISRSQLLTSPANDASSCHLLFFIPLNIGGEMLPCLGPLFLLLPTTVFALSTTPTQDHFLQSVAPTKTLLDDITQNGKIVIKVGHIGAVNALRNDALLLEISRKSLHKEGILGDDLDIELVSQNGCGDSYEGVAVAADMYHLQKVKAFIGPYCNSRRLSCNSTIVFHTEIDAVARMAAFWNLPIIGYMAASSALADKRAYKTLARISTRSTNSIAEATCALLKHYRWNKIAIVTNVGAVAWDRTTAFEEVFHTRGVQVVKKVMFDEYADGAAMRASGLIQEVRNTARVIVFLFSNTREQSKEFMIAAQGEGMLASEYVFILPWLQDGAKEASPWIGADGSMLQNVKDQYANAIIIDDVNGFDNSIVAPFLERVKEEGLTEADVDIANIYAYIYLFDALKLYAMGARKVLNETNNPAAVLDGLRVWNSMRRMVFPGIVGASGVASGIITMDDRAERAPLYRGFFISPHQDQVMAMAHMEPTMIDPSRCDGTVNRSGCYDIVVTDMMTNFWPSFDNRMPLDEPLCGFRNERCDYTSIIIGSGRSTREDLLEKYIQRRPIIFNRADKTMFQQMKAAVHDNINPFLGISFNEKEEMLLVWKFCNRGTLQDIIYNDQIDMDNKFHGAFIRDIVGGLEYLHASPVGYHGSLTPWSCLIDRNWMVKLTDYGVAEPIERWEKNQWITVDELKSDDDKSNAKQKTSALYDAPEMLKMRENNKVRRMDQDWQRQSSNRRQLGDVYAFGMIMYEIIFRALPFPDTQDVTELIDAVKDGSRVIKPSIQDHKLIHMDLAALVQDCWNTTPEMRPSLRRIKLNVETYLKVKGSLVDQMMRMMEQYANNLEKLVKERTGMLEEANIRADKLLSQLLPAYVARELKEGKPVPPKTFTSATVMFSDIVGFGDMCRDATAAEIVNLLNSVFNGFDEFIARREAYKVETIGDAYMFVSGVPEENGFRHLDSICSIAMDIHSFLHEFRAPHSSTLRVRCRLGVCSGPVAAAVVGLNAPRYCLFGDTVNMASRMESTGEAEKTQIAESTKLMLDKHYPDFITKERGQVQVKGKGLCTTYWLEGSRDASTAYTAPTRELSRGHQNFSSLLGGGGF